MNRVAPDALDLDPDGLLARAEAGLRLADSLGTDDAEVYLWWGRTHELLQSHRTRTFEESDRSGVSVRVLLDDRLAFAKTSGIQEEEVRWAVRRAVNSARLVPPQEGLDAFADPIPTERAPTPVHPELVDVDPERIREIGDQVEDAAYRAGDPNYFSERLLSSVGLFALATSGGARTWDRHAHESIRLAIRCNQGESHKVASAFRASRAPVHRDHDLDREARGAVERAQRATKTVALDGFVDEVILDTVPASLILDKVLPSLGGRAAHQERSVFSGKLDQQVASKALTIVDRPHGPSGCRHQRVDDEGVPTQKTPLIQDGMLVNFLYGWQASRETGEPPTGHGLRALTNRYEGQPSERAVNPVVEPGGQSLEELVEAADEAVLVKDAIMGDFTMDPLTGEFSFVAPLAFHVCDGEIKDALVSTSLSGNLFEALGDIRGLGREAADFPHGSFVPLHIGEVTCAT